MPKMISNNDLRSPGAEAYRVLRANLQYSSPDNPVRSLLVTSVTPQEGKSTTVSNLGMTFAQAGKKTLLIDGDLRKPTLHKLFGMSNEVGFTNLIVGDCKVGEAVRSSGVDNLSILTSGPIPPNPAELLSSKRGKQLIAEFEKDHDLVLIDSPPIAAVSDGLVLSKLVTGTLLVIDHGVVKREMAKTVVDQLRNIKANIVGVVLNRAPLNETGYYYEYG